MGKSLPRVFSRAFPSLPLSQQPERLEQPSLIYKNLLRLTWKDTDDCFYTRVFTAIRLNSKSKVKS